MARRNDDDFDLDRVLKDGERMRVPLRMMDSLSRDVAAHFGRTMVQDAKIVDGFGNGGLSLHRPGHRLFSSGQGDQSFYDEYDRDISTRYRDANHTAGVEGVGSSGFAGRRVGDRCMVKSKRDIGEDGDRGRIMEIDGELVCVSDNHRNDDALDVRDHQQRMSDLYSELDRELSNAWRGR